MDSISLIPNRLFSLVTASPASPASSHPPFCEGGREGKREGSPPRLSFALRAQDSPPRLRRVGRGRRAGRGQFHFHRKILKPNRRMEIDLGTSSTAAMR
jgi:hypothetical protein